MALHETAEQRAERQRLAERLRQAGAHRFGQFLQCKERGAPQQILEHLLKNVGRLYAKAFGTMVAQEPISLMHPGVGQYEIWKGLDQGKYPGAFNPKLTRYSVEKHGIPDARPRSEEELWNF